MEKLPLGVDINNLISDLRILSWEAADILIYYSQMLKNPSDKEKLIQNTNLDDPVTIADLSVNELIIQGIKQIYKNVEWDILSEENVKSGKTNCNQKSDWLWVFDPLDGTKDFIQGTGNYAMHLALNYKQKPYLGIVLIPEKDELWFATREKCWGEKRDGSKIKTQVNNFQNFEDMTLVTSKNHNNDTLKKLIDKIPFGKVVVMGSIGCKIISIVKGECDIYICLSLQGKSSPKDWDFAAPESILVSSGGAITNLDNENLSYNQPGYEQNGIIIASKNKQNHEGICLKLREIIKKYNLNHF